MMISYGFRLYHVLPCTLSDKPKIFRHLAHPDTGESFTFGGPHQPDPKVEDQPTLQAHW